MAVIYEINPPKIPDGMDESNKEVINLIEKLEQRVSEISLSCDGIHVTDSVLGTRRVSALRIGKIIKKNNPHLKITISMRTRDREMNSIKETVKNAIEIGLDGILVLMGDPSKNKTFDSGLIPSKVVKELSQSEFAGKIEFFLSLPSNPNFEKIQKKISAKPAGFMTQVIHSLQQVQRISEKLRPMGFRIIPCVLLPSEKNHRSAKFLNLDWSGYNQDPVKFIKDVYKISGDVLITSPNDFAYAKDILGKI